MGVANRSDYEPGVWHELSGDDIKDWRRRLNRGTTRQVIGVGHRSLSPITGEGDTVTMGSDHTPRAFVEPSEVAERMVPDFLTELLATKAVSESAFLDRIRRLKELAPGLQSMTDEDLAAQLHVLAEKVTMAIAEQRYHKLGKLRPVEMDRTGVGHETQAILLPGQVGR